MFVRRIARPLLSAVFISGGIDSLRNPGPKVDAAEPVIDLVAEAAQPVAQRAAARASGSVERAVGALDDALDSSSVATDSVPGTDDATSAAHRVSSAVHDVADGKALPVETATFVQANGAVQVAAGILLSTGKAPRLASAALAATLVPTTLAGHRFWEHEGTERAAHRTHFLKNVGLLGGLLLAAVDTEGRPGLAWRAKRARGDASMLTEAAKATAAVGAHAASLDAKAAKRLAKANAKVAGKGGKLGVEVVGERATELGRLLHDRAADLAPVVQERAADLAARAGVRA